MDDVFVPVEREQSFLMQVDFRELLGGDHLVWTVIEVVESLDLSFLYARYGDHPQGGRRAFDPRMMLALLIYGYAQGLRSSRELERACRLSFDYRAVTGNQEPDHATIARFRASLDAELGALFAQVLGVCRERGLGKLGLVAVDGTKIGAAASKAKNLSGGQLDDLEVEARRIVAEAAAADSAEQTTTATAPPSPAGRPNPAGRLPQVEAARARLEAKKQQPGRAVQKNKEPLVNLTDPDSGLMKCEGGFLQGYNAQAVATEDQLVIAAVVCQDPNDVRLLGPMLAAAAANLQAAGGAGQLGTVVADAGYWSEANSKLEGAEELLIATSKGHRVGKNGGHPPLEPLTPPLPPVSLTELAQQRQPILAAAATGEITRHQAAELLGLSYVRTWELVRDYQLRGEASLLLKRRPNRNGSRRPPPTSALARQAMEAKLSQPENLARYRKRAPTIEGVFAHTKSHRGYRRFLRRGLAAVDAEWKLIHLAANIRKAHRHTPTPLLPSPRIPRCRTFPIRPHRPPAHRSAQCRIKPS